MDQELFLPVLSHFENGNFWTASGGRMRYRVDPVKEEDVWAALEAQVWEGPWNLVDSTVEETVRFPLSEEGWISSVPGCSAGRSRSTPVPPRL